jgi:hypothetical protein
MQFRISNSVSQCSSRRRVCCQAVQRPSAAASPTTARAADHAQQAASSKAVAGLAATLLAASALSPVAAWADGECVGPFCSGTPGSMVAAAQDFTGGHVRYCVYRSWIRLCICVFVFVAHPYANAESMQLQLFQQCGLVHRCCTVAQRLVVHGFMLWLTSITGSCRRISNNSRMPA